MHTILDDVRRTLSRLNPCKATRLDSIPGRVLRDCANQLADVLIDIFNICLSQASKDHHHSSPKKVNSNMYVSVATTLYLWL